MCQSLWVNLGNSLFTTLSHVLATIGVGLSTYFNLNTGSPVDWVPNTLWTGRSTQSADLAHLCVFSSGTRRHHYVLPSDWRARVN